MADGWSAAEVFSSSTGWCGYDDIAVLPGEKMIDAAVVNVNTRFTRNVTLSNPIVAGPSEKVTETRMAVALALAGGIGIIHGNQSIASQAKMVTKVKQAECGFILDPCTLGPQHKVEDIDRIKAKQGCSGIPITDNGKMGGKLVGLCTAHDIENVADRKTKVAQVMTKQVVYAQEPVTLREAKEKLLRTKVGKLPVVNEDMELVGLICRGDLKRLKEIPGASRDVNKQLLVGAAIGPGSDDDYERACELVEAGVDVLLVETSDGVFDSTVDLVRQLKAEKQNTDIIVGPITSCQEARSVLEAGADAIRVGRGNRIDLGHSEATAVYEIGKYARANFGVPVMADGGICGTAELMKALCLGASSAVLDEQLARTAEAPGESFFRDGVCVRLSGPPEADSKKTPIRVGVIGETVDKGPVKTLVPYLLKGVKRSFQELGMRNMNELQAALLNGSLRFERQIPAAPKPPPAQPQSVRVAASTLNNRW